MRLGMADYQVRSWRIWHHHMTLVCLAQLFVTQERLAAQDTPLLSAREVVQLLAHYFPCPGGTAEKIEWRVGRRHKPRAEPIKSYAPAKCFTT